jgi:hypothetical protein
MLLKKVINAFKRLNCRSRLSTKVRDRTLQESLLIQTVLTENHSNMVLKKDNIKIYLMAIKTILRETRRKKQGMKYTG